MYIRQYGLCAHTAHIRGRYRQAKRKKNTVNKLADKKGNSSFIQQIKIEFVKRDFK